MVLSAAAEYAAPVPIAENDLLAAWLLDVAQLDVPTGPLSSGTCEVSISPGDTGGRRRRRHGGSGAVGEGL